jgi:mono/diheme cytochrome c family protein
MRERWARRLAWITCCLVLVFTAAFAVSYNAGETATSAEPVVPVAPASAPDDAARVEAGRAVYASLDCLGCHSIAGEGSPRSPLDGVGSRLDQAEIRAWTLGEDAVAEELSPRALRAKRGYRELDGDDIAALVAYLASLTE